MNKIPELISKLALAPSEVKGALSFLPKERLKMISNPKTVWSKNELILISNALTYISNQKVDASHIDPTYLPEKADLDNKDSNEETLLLIEESFTSRRFNLAKEIILKHFPDVNDDDLNISAMKLIESYEQKDRLSKLNIIENEDFTLWIDPGDSSKEILVELLASISDLNKLCGGAGIIFQNNPTKSVILLDA